MGIDKTVIISCAGVGSRLGLNTTKALIEIEGKPLIIWQLEMLTEVKKVIIVVGYQAERVIKVVKKIREDAIFVFNYDYLITGTATSFALGANKSNGMVISLDGDLLIHPDDCEKLINTEYECIGCCIPSSEEPVYVNVKEINNEKWVSGFSREEGLFEWTGIVQIQSNKVDMTYGHVYQMLEKNKLPMRLIELRTQEIDTPNDYKQAINWVKKYMIKDGIYKNEKL